ncbi:MAG TPA: response regulator [Planctomycetota bacterium]|nr:response regulator [Planctomycetota bacterium]
MTAKTGTKRILVADDDPQLCQLIHDFLETQGVETTLASDGEEAVKAANGSVFNLCIMDYDMPRMNGIAACEQLRSMPHTATLPVLFLTAMDDTKSVDQAFSAGATDFLVKPVNLKLLWNRISLLMRLSELDGETQRLKSAIAVLPPA